MSKSRQYEKLVQELHAGLIDNDEIENITVQHDVKILGRSGTKHQIDVYWEFKVAGQLYKTCIECKYWKSKVEKRDIVTFSAILEDIGNATGIFATSVGYQSGALKFASAKGVRLILVNYLIKSISIKGNFQQKITDIVAVNFDHEQAKEVLKSKGLEKYDYQLNVTEGEMLYDGSGSPVETIKDAFDLASNNPGEGTLQLTDRYLRIEIGDVRIRSIDYLIKHASYPMESSFELEGAARAIMEDVVENRQYYLDDDGRVSEET